MPFDLDLGQLDIGDPTVRRTVLTALVLVTMYVVIRVGQRIAVRYLEAPEVRYRTTKRIGRAGGLLTLLAIISIWSPGVQDALTVLTIIGAGLAIAMREALLSLVGWINLAIRAPYRQGDRIEVNGVRGDVVDIRLFHSTLMEIGGWVHADQSTGRLVHIPNGWVFQHEVYNYTRGFGFIWNELPVTVTFRSDWEAAREIILSLAQESAAIVEQQAAREIRQMSREYLVHYSILTPFVYVHIAENGIRLTLRYLCEARKRRGTDHAITLSLLRALQEHGGIELAYPMVGVSHLEPPQFGPLPGPTADRPGSNTAAPGEQPPGSSTDVASR